MEQTWSPEPLAKPLFPGIKTESDGARIRIGARTPFYFASSSRGYAASETKASLEQARMLIEQAEALGEPIDDPLVPFSVLFGFWVSNYVAFNGRVLCELAARFL